MTTMGVRVLIEQAGRRCGSLATDTRQLESNTKLTGLDTLSTLLI